MFDYSFIETEKLIITTNLRKLVGAELSVNKNQNYTQKDIKNLINNTLNYVKTTGNEIKDGETFGYGIWLLKFVFNGTYIELHELKDVVNGVNTYDFDLSNSINFLKKQTELSTENDINLNIPKLAQKIAISKEIYQGSEVNAVRYEAPEHMSGWYLTSNSYNGDINTLHLDSLFHLIKTRPDLIKYLGLPAGFRFFKDDQGEEFWYDPD